MYFTQLYRKELQRSLFSEVRLIFPLEQPDCHRRTTCSVPWGVSSLLWSFLFCSIKSGSSRDLSHRLAQISVVSRRLPLGPASLTCGVSPSRPQAASVSDQRPARPSVSGPLGIWGLLELVAPGQHRRSCPCLSMRPSPMSCALCLRREPCASRGRGWEPGEAPSALKCSSSQVLQLGMVGEPRAPPGEPRHQHRPGAPLLKLSGLLPSPGALPPMPRKLLGHPPLGFSPYGKSELPFMVPLSLSSVLEALL